MLYRRVDLPSDEPVQFVGVYVLRWCSLARAEVGFVEADEDEDLRKLLAEAAAKPRPMGAVNQWWWEWHERVRTAIGEE